MYSPIQVDGDVLVVDVQTDADVAGIDVSGIGHALQPTDQALIVFLRPSGVEVEGKHQVDLVGVCRVRLNIQKYAVTTKYNHRKCLQAAITELSEIKIDLIS